MHSLEIQDINKDTLFVFLLSYYFNLSYVKLSKVYSISDRLFWAYIDSFTPLLKVGVRKLSQISSSVEKILKFYNNENKYKNRLTRYKKVYNYFKTKGRMNKFTSKNFSDLNLKKRIVKITDDEKYLISIFNYFLADSYYNGKNFYHINNLKNVDFSIKGFDKLPEYITTYEFLLYNFEKINYILVNDEEYAKVSRCSYLLEKYHNDLNCSAVAKLTVKQIVEKLEEIT